MSTLPPPPLSPLAGAAPPTGPQSAVDALMPAWENTKRILFAPFRARTWFKLGFIAWLAGVMSGGGSGGGGNFGGPSGSGGPGGSGGGPDPAEMWAQVVAWYHAHAAAVLAGAVALGVLVIGLSLLMVYVSSIFRFIFLESVITNETRIRESWHRNRAEGLSFFWWRLGFGSLAFLFVAIVVGVPAGLMAMSLAGQPGTPSGSAIAGSIGLGLLAFGLLIIALVIIGLINALTRDFVLPLMYLRRVGVLAAWRECWGIVGGNKFGFFVYFLMKAVAAFVTGIAGMILALGALLVACIPLGILAGIGYLVVLAAGIDSWSWSYLWALVPTGIVVILALSYWVTCCVLPVPVFFQSYALKYLGHAEPSAVTI